VRRQYRGGRVLLAIDGVDGAGKTVFADGLADVFAEGGSTVFRSSIDGFHRPRSERYVRGRRNPEGFYRDSYDYPTFRRVLIDPFREGWQTAATTGFQLEAFDLGRDAPVESAWVAAPLDAVLIVDGIFLHRPELRDLWDWSVWLDVPYEVAYARMALRDGCDPDPDAPSNARYRQGQQIYLNEADPGGAASVIVDNADLAHPHRVPRGAR
jgi:uridine kinase